MGILSVLLEITPNLATRATGIPLNSPCSFHGLRSEDPNQHLKDFLKLVDSLDLDGTNRERTRMRLFQFSLCNQASNWLERLLAGSITTWEDLTTHFLAQFFPSGRTAKLRNDILIKEDEAKEEDGEKSTATDCKGHETTDETEVKVESKEEVKEETEEEAEEEKEGNPKHFDTFPTMNELRLHYNWIMSNRLEPRRKLSNLKKNCNFIGRVWGLKVFVGNFTYECDFMVLKDTTSVIDHYLGSVVFGKPFMEATMIVYNKEEGTVVFEKDKEKIIFKMPHKMDMFKHIDFADRGTDSIPPFIIKSDDDNCEKTYYFNNLDLGLEYKYDEYACRGIRSLMAAKARRKNKGEDT
ncbi:protein kinase-like domain, concanavalin A-like lectin/glucanase domain protein [Tanacetum coccineum]